MCESSGRELIDKAIAAKQRELEPVTLLGMKCEIVPSSTAYVNLAGGHELVFAGLQKTAHDVAVTLKERRDLIMWNSINRWSEYCRAHQTQHGHYKKDYSVTARLFVFDQISKEVARFVLYGFWPNNVPSIAYDASASNAIEHSITFKCDFFENEMTEETTDWANSIWGPHQNRPF
jgi:hypothetical protein